MYNTRSRYSVLMDFSKTGGGYVKLYYLPYCFIYSVPMDGVDQVTKIFVIEFKTRSYSL